MDPADITDPEIIQADDEVRFAPRGQSVEQMPATPATAQAATGCEYVDIVNMIKTLNGEIAAIARDTASIQRAYEQLRSENVARDKALTDLSEIVREYGLSPIHRRPQPVLREDVMDRDGNLRGADMLTSESHGKATSGWTRSLETTWHETGDVDATPTDRRTRSRRFAIDRPPTNTTGDVDTVSTNGRTGPGPWNLISSTADTREDNGDPRGG